MNIFKQIAIDGPAAAGKSTIAKLMANRLGYVYVDTGAMYRAITWATLHHQIDVANEQAIADLLTKIDINLTPEGDVFVNKHNITTAIRDLDVTAHVPQVATYQAVREDLKERQVNLAKSANIIMDGRDIGTNVLPEADFKFFMVADPRIRAQRRHQENLSKGIASDIDVLESEIKVRDEQDRTRIHAPLKQAEDAILIDTSKLSINEVVDKMVSIILQ